MQKKKEDIYKSILIVAKKEFLTRGYKNTTMRIIAKQSDVGLSNIYNYFENKDSIFVKVLSPLLEVINTIFDDHNKDECLTLEALESEKIQTQSIKMMVDLVENYRVELKILLFHSYGSSLGNFRDEYAKRYTEVTLEYIEKMKIKHPEINTNISPFLIHTLGSWMLTIIGEIISHNELSHQKIEKFMADFVLFGSAGWKELFKNR